MDILRDWKTGAVVGLMYGIATLLIHPSIESRVYILVCPLYLIFTLMYLPITLFTKISDIENILIPISGIILGVLLWKGMELFCRKRPDYNPWKKGLVIGFIYGICAVLWFGIPLPNPYIGLFLFAPLMILNLCISDAFLGGVYMNLPFFLLFIINGMVLGCVIGYVICPGKIEEQKPDDEKRRGQILRVAVAIISILVVIALMIFSGFH